MKPTILYPFSLSTDFEAGFVWAEELARRMKANLVLLTAVSQRSDEKVMHVYDAILRAQGHQAQFETENHILPGIRIEVGELPLAILDHLKKNLVDVLVLDPHLPFEINNFEKEFVDAANSAIILQAANGWQDQTRSFFSRFQSADIRKLPDHIYSTLSNDRGFFNFLGSMFRRNAS